jgi:hypothetical protein
MRLILEGPYVYIYGDPLDYEEKSPQVDKQFV